jgi:flagellar basal body-associated protein FliL
MQCPFCGTQLPSTDQICTTCGNSVDISAQEYNTPTPYPGLTEFNQQSTQYGSTTDPNQRPSTYEIPPYPPLYQQPSSQYNQSYPPQSAPPYQPYPGQLGASYGGNAPYPGQIPGYAPPRQKPKSHVGIIITIITIALVVLCIGGSVIANYVSSKSDQSITTRVIPTTTNTNPALTDESPSGTAIDPQAAAIITNPQTVSKIDKTTFAPIKGTATSTFKTNEVIYITFDLNTHNIDVANGTDYINALFYIGSTNIVTDDPFQVKATYNDGYFSATYYKPTTAGAAEIYWCHTSTCSDGKLAQVINFTVIE